MDRLSALFLLLICGVSFPVIIYSQSYLPRHYSPRQCRLIRALMSLFILSMAVVALASTAFAFLLAWELMTLVSAALIMVDGVTAERRHNVFIYLVMMHAGAALLAAAFFSFLPFSRDLRFESIRQAGLVLTPAARTAIFLLAFAGLGAKAGIIPLHLWLPRAHPIAPTPVSALMSGVMLKTAIYGFIRFTFDFLRGGPWWGGYLALFAGGVTGVLGILYALGEHDLKRLLAYSSIENIGIIYMGLGGALIFLANQRPEYATLALVAALFHTVNHALFKSLLFLGAGAVSDSAHSLNLNHLGGILRRMPVTGSVLLVGAMSMVGLPLTNGFVSELLMLQSFLAGSSLATTYYYYVKYIGGPIHQTWPRNKYSNRSFSPAKAGSLAGSVPTSHQKFFLVRTYWRRMNR